MVRRPPAEHPRNNVTLRFRGIEPPVAAFATEVGRLTGNPVQVLDYDLAELRRRTGPRATTGRTFWDALRRDAIVLAGASVDELLTGTHVASR